MKNRQHIEKFYSEVLGIKDHNILKEVVDASEYITVPKKTCIYFIGDKINDFIFCDDACVKATAYDEDGEKYIEGYSFKRGVPLIEEDITQGGDSAISRLVFETIKDSTFIRIGADKGAELIKKSPEINAYYINTLIFSAALNKKKSHIKNLSAIERVEFFDKYYKEVLPYATKEDISNFLKINITTYIKIKNNNYKLSK